MRSTRRRYPTGSFGSMRWALVALFAAIALLAAACGDSGSGSSDNATGGDTATSTTAASSTTAADSGGDSGGGDSTTTAATEPANTDPIKIGALTSLTGPFTSWGIPSSTGMQLAVDEINAAGGVNGRMLELVIVDDQSNPEEAVKGFNRLIDDGVVAVAGTISSGVALAEAQIAEDEGIPLFLSKAGSAAILTPDSRFTFRTCLAAAPMIAAPWAQYVEDQGFSRVGVIVADYAWGQSFKTAVEDTFGAMDGVEYQIEVAPVKEQDFTTYLRSLEDFDPQIILGTGHPPGVGPILVQSTDLGFDVGITGPASSLGAVMERMGDAAIGRYLDYSCADYFSDSYADLAKRYIDSSGQPFMEDDAVAGYGVVTMVADAIENVGDDPEAIAEYLHGQTYDLPGYAFQMGWTEWGELSDYEPLLVGIGPGPAPEGLNKAGDWWPVPLVHSARIEPYVPS